MRGRCGPLTKLEQMTLAFLEKRKLGGRRRGAKISAPRGTHQLRLDSRDEKRNF
jgi:hypothetical protein